MKISLCFSVLCNLEPSPDHESGRTCNLANAVFIITMMHAISYSLFISVVSQLVTMNNVETNLST